VIVVTADRHVACPVEAAIAEPGSDWTRTASAAIDPVFTTSITNEADHRLSRLLLDSLVSLDQMRA
jgi:hypothetical protein